MDQFSSKRKIGTKPKGREIREIPDYIIIPTENDFSADGTKNLHMMSLNTVDGWVDREEKLTRGSSRFQTCEISMDHHLMCCMHISYIITSESESPPNDLACTEPREAFYAKQCSNAHILNLQIFPVLPGIFGVIEFPPEWLITMRDTAHVW